MNTIVTMYHESSSVTCNTALDGLSSEDAVNGEQLDPEILLSIKQEDLLQDEDINFTEGTSLDDSSKKFFELTPVGFDSHDAFPNCEAIISQENCDDRLTRTERKMPSKWSEDTTLKFVKEYKYLECLWDVKSPSYRNKAARDAAYQKLAECANLPGFTVQEAKNKIKNLRSTYSQELKKVRQSRKCGSDEVYQPSLIWYKEIDAFLGPVIASRDVHVTVETDVGSTNDEVITENEDTLEGNVQALSPNSRHSTPTDSADIQGDKRSVKRIIPNPPMHIPTCIKKKKITNVSQTTNPFHATFSTSNRNDDEFDAFGKSVAAQLKNFSLTGALKTQVKIQSLLTQERIIDAMEYGVIVSNDDFHQSLAPLTPTSHHSQASQNESPCCNCTNETQHHTCNSGEVMEDINSTDILSQAVNSILPQ